MKKLIYVLPLIVSNFVFASYEDHFPAYFEYCAGTQYKLQSGKEGGKGGHGLSYVHGLCKDYTQNYPHVIPCSDVSPELRAKYPHEGVGISVDNSFYNANWVAVPGRDLTWFGNKERQSLTEADLNEAVQTVTDLRVFEGIIFNIEEMKTYEPGSKVYLEEAAKDTMGTDYAVSWARELHCVKIPVPTSTLKKAADLLNDANLKYKNGAEYKWDMLYNNCSQNSVNISASMGINAPVKLDQNFFVQLFNISVPSNTYLKYVDDNVLATISVKKIAKSKTFKENGFYPVQVGSLMAVYEAFPPSPKFNTGGVDAVTLPRFHKPTKVFADPRKYDQKYLKPETHQLKANAVKWVQTYSAMLKNLPEKFKGTAFEEYLENQLQLSERIVNSEN